jgi:hypothetical protein
MSLNPDKIKPNGQSSAGIDQGSMPFGAEIAPDPATKRWLIEQLNARYNQPRQGIHVSDLVFCPRLSVFRKISPKPYDEKQVVFFAIGKVVHDLLESLLGGQTEVKYVWEEIEAHIDSDADVPAEIKTTRSFAHKPNEHWVRQLAYYCAIKGVNTARLIVLHLSPERPTKKNPTPEANMIDPFDITFSDIEAIREELRARRDVLKKALERRDPALAPRAGSDTDWLCPECEYRAECNALEAGQV